LQGLAPSFYQSEICFSHCLCECEFIPLGQERGISEASMQLIHDISACQAESIDYIVEFLPSRLETLLFATDQE
jgi:hypothetical protein